MANEQIWSGSAWVDAPVDMSVTAVGTKAASGRVWDGRSWVEPRMAPTSATQPAATTPWVKPPVDPIARRLTGVIFGLIAVLCAVAAISMQPAFGRDAGGLAMLLALAVAAGFGVAALVKSS